MRVRAAARAVLIAHASDLHALAVSGLRFSDFLSHKRLGGAANLLLRRGRRHPLALFEALVDDLNRVRPDHVVLTGDLVNLSLASEFARARSLLDRLLSGPHGVTVVPGNHDVYTPGAARARAFESAFAPYALSDGAQEVEYPVLRRRGALFIVGLSSARPSPVPLADGRLGPVQLERAAAALAGAGPGTFRLVLLHHPPFANRSVLLRGLRDRAALQAVLARTGAELVLHGHEHRDVRTTLAGPRGPIPVIGVGSATYDDPRPARRARYNLLRIGPELEFTVETRVHDPVSGRFVAFDPERPRAATAG